MKKTLFLCLLVLPISILAQTTNKEFIKGRFDMDVTTKYFKTNSNYGPNGDKQNLASGASLQSINLLTTARYAFFENFGFYSGVFFNNVESTNGTIKRTSSILTHYLAGVDFSVFKTEQMRFYIDSSYSASNEQINLNSDNALASDGASEAKLSTVGLFRTESTLSFAKLGINYRTEGLSTLLIYGFGSQYSFDSSAIGVSFDGFSSIKDDDKTATPALRETLTNQVNAGSRMFYAINPNLLSGELFYQYILSKDLSIKLSAGSTIVGSNAAQGFFGAVNLAMGFGGGPAKVRSKNKPKTNNKAQNNNFDEAQDESIEEVENKSKLPDSEPGFQLDTDDGVDQNLFKNTQPSQKKK